MFSLYLLVTIGLGGGQRVTLPGSIGEWIVVAPMGTDHQAVYFRKLLENQFKRHGSGPDAKTSLILDWSGEFSQERWLASGARARGDYETC